MPLTPELFDQIDMEVQKRKQAGQWTPEYETAYAAVRAKAVSQFPTHFAQQVPPATPASSSFSKQQTAERAALRAHIQAMSPEQRDWLRVEGLDASRFGSVEEQMVENQARLFRGMDPLTRAISSGVAQSAGSVIGLAGRGLEAIGVNDPGTTDEFNRAISRIGQGQALAGAGKAELIGTGVARVVTDLFTGGRLTKVLGGGSSTFLGIQSAQVANDAFTQGRDSGLSDTAATNFALREGGSNFLFSMIAGKVLGQGFENMAPAAKQAFKQSFTEVAKRKGLDFGKMFAQELPEEIAQNIGSAFNKTYSGLRDKTYESVEAFWEEQLTTAAVTALVAGGRTAMPSLSTGPRENPEAPSTAEITTGPGNLADRNLQTGRPEAPSVQDESRLLPAPTQGQVIGDNSQGLLGPAEPAQVTDNTAGKTGFFVSPRGTAIAADIDPIDRQRALDIVDGPAGPGSFTQQQQESQAVTDELGAKAQQVTERQKKLQDRLGKFGITVGEPEQATSMKIGTRTFKTELSPAEIDDHSALISPREDITDADEIDADIAVQRGNREAALKRPDGNFIMVDLPVAAFEPRNSEEGLAKGEKFKAQSGDTAPPIVAGIPAADDKGRLITTDGDSRLKAALLRGDKTIKAYVPKGDVEELKQRLAAKRAKQGPPKVKAEAESTLPPKAKAIQTQIDELTQQAAEQRRLGRLLPARRLDQAVTRAIKERDAIVREDNRAEAETSIAKAEARDAKLTAEQKAKDAKFAADQAEKDQFVSEQVKKAADARKQAQPDGPSRPKPNKVVQRQAAQYIKSVNIEGLKETGKTGNNTPQTQAPASTSVTGHGVATAAAQTEPRFSIDSIGDHVRDWLSAAGTYNRPAEWVDHKRAAKAGDTVARERAIQWSRRWGKQMESAGIVFADATTAQALWRTLRGDGDMKQWPPAVQDLLNNWRKTQDRFSREAADAYRAAGMEDMAKAYEDNIGTYVKSVPKWTLTAVGRVGRAIKTWRESLTLTPSFGKFRRDAWIVVDGRKRVVQKFADEASAKAFRRENAEGKAWKVLAPRTDAERAVEDVLDPRYNLIAGTGEAAHNASMVNLHKWVADNHAQKPPKGLKGEALESWAKAQELVRLPNQGKFHKLHDVYVPGTIAADLTDMVDMPSGIMAIMGSYLNVWKASKTVWNISSHFVNTMSNAVGFANLARIGLANPANWKHYASGFNAIIEKGAKWEEMVKAGAIGGEYYGNEVALIKRSAMDMTDGPGGMFASVAKAFRKTGAALGKAYNFEDAIFKAAAYSKYRSEGMDTKQASDEVNKWFPNYDRTSRLAQMWSRNPVIGTPFASFTDQAIRITGRAAKDRPIMLMAMLAAPAMIAGIGRMLAGSTEEEERVVRANQGFSERYFTPTIGRDSKGSLLTLDLRRLVPLANDLTAGQQDHGAITTTLFANGPFVRTLIEQMAGKDMFTGRDIITAGDRAKNLVKNVLPIPSWLQFGPQRITKSLDTRDSKREDLALAIIGTVVGINTRTPYAAEQKVKASIARAWADDDNDLATSMMEVWNDKYRPDDLERIKQSDIVKQAEKLNETAYRVLSVNGREVGKFDTKDDAQNWIDESPERRRSRIVAPPK